MERHVNYRGQLLKAVDLFLERTPDAMARAHRIVRHCQNTLRPFTLESMVWDGFITMLTDSVYYDDITYLPTLHDELAGKTSTRARTYVNFDFREELSPNESLWLATAQEALVFLRGFPFTEIGSDAALQTYQRLTETLHRIRDHEGNIPLWSEETIYHLILREVTEITTHINLKLSVLRLGYLAALAPYASMRDDLTVPDATDTLIWAQKALDAITGKAWLLVTWQITPDQVHLSFH